MILDNIIQKVNYRFSFLRRIHASYYRQSSPKIKANLSEIYSQSLQERILDVLNNIADSSPKLKITEKQIKTFQNYLSTNGKFKNLDEVLCVNGIGPKLLERLCDRILSDETSNNGITQSHPKLKSNLIAPAIDELEKKHIKSIVGLQIGNFSVSWARLDFESKTITNWELSEFVNVMDSKSLISVYEFVLNVMTKIPSSDMYVIENTNWSVMSSQTNLLNHVRAAQTTAILLTLLNSNEYEYTSSSDEEGVSEKQSQPEISTNHNKVYFLKTYLPTRYFRTLVGTERVSPQKMVEDMFDGNFPSYCSSFYIEELCKDYYFKKEKPLRESLCQSLLLIVTFMDVILLNKTNFLKPKVKNVNR